MQRVNFIASDNALRVFAEELGIKGRNNLVQQLLGKKSEKIQAQNNDDIGANVASGSYPTHAMIVIPCSMGTLARVAHGLAGNLIDRAADVCLKEKRPLVLCTRETPLNRVHIRNMDWAAEAGATIYPLIPTFYNQPKSFERDGAPVRVPRVAVCGVGAEGCVPVGRVVSEIPSAAREPYSHPRREETNLKPRIYANAHESGISFKNNRRRASFVFIRVDSRLKMLF